MTSLSISTLRLNGGTQSRESIDPSTVEAYADAMRSGAKFPEPVVFYDGSIYWLADGFHRVEARRANGETLTDCDVRQGDRRAAILFSVGANASHGLRRTNADKRRAVLLLLSDEEWSAKSDRWIAEKCCVDHKTVAGLRPTGEVPQFDGPRLGQDGKTRKLPTRTEDPAPPSSRPAPDRSAACPPEEPMPRSAAAHARTEETVASSRDPRRVEHERRAAEVQRLHDLGKGTTEIARTMGIEPSSVSSIKSQLGIASTSAAVKLWTDVDHVATTLEGTVLQIDRLTGLLRDASSLKATKEEIGTCRKSLATSMAAIGRLSAALLKRRS